MGGPPVRRAAPARSVNAYLVTIANKRSPSVTLMAMAPLRDAAFSTLACVRCSGPCVDETIATLNVARCMTGCGVFAQMVALRAFVLTPIANSDELADALRRWNERPNPLAATGYVKCPQCATLMNRSQFAKGAKIIVDLCIHHGVWFDRGELSGMIEFVRRGGLVAASQRMQADELRDARTTGGWSLFEAMVRIPKP